MKYGKRKMVLGVLAGLAAMAAMLFLLSAPKARAAALTVTSTADRGPGTLRQCLLDAEKGDTITFDPNVFPEGNPVTITITSGRLPNLDKDDVTIDGAGAGVIIDGSSLSSEFDDGLRITSHRNTIKGLTIQNFPGDGVDILDGAQGNRVEHCAIGGNGQRGVRVAGSNATGNTITRNSITDNGGSGIITTDGGNVELAPPIINSVVTSANNITAAGLALPGVVVELFVDPGGEGATFLGSTMADDEGYFTLVVTGVTLGDDNVTATATDGAGNTSMFTCYPIPIPSLIWPLSGSSTPDGPFSSPFGPRLQASEDFRYDWHRGIDIPAQIGTSVYACTDGKVRCAGVCSGYSDLIVQLEHEDGCYYCNYLHMSGISVTTGQMVTQGMAVGTTGVSTSGFAHLHFEIRRGGYYQRNAINPFVYLPYADTRGPTPVIGGLYVHTASVTPTVTAWAVVTTPANELDFNRLEVTVTDGAQECDRRAVDLHVFNMQKSTIEHPEALDDPYVDHVCIMPARFNKDSDEYRIDFIFYGLQGSDSITVTAEAADVHFNRVFSSARQNAGRVSIFPNYAESWVSPGMTATLIHTPSDTYTFALSTACGRSREQWGVQVNPSSVTLGPGESDTMTVTVAVPATVPVGTVDYIAVTAVSEHEVQAVVVDVAIAARTYLPTVLKGYSQSTGGQSARK
jgi:hypothetical protein